VRATLRFGIHHSFVQTTAGPPQWVAPDGSSITGARVSSTPNGDGNIPELELAATQTGRAHGLLSRTVRVLRLNTRGGVAPAGSCTPDSIAEVPYRADSHSLSQYPRINHQVPRTNQFIYAQPPPLRLVGRGSISVHQSPPP